MQQAGWVKSTLFISEKLEKDLLTLPTLSKLPYGWVFFRPKSQQKMKIEMRVKLLYHQKRRLDLITE